MSFTILNYSDYYKTGTLNGFIDPLYKPYQNKTMNLLENKKYLNLNLNEFRINKGKAFKRKTTNYPCPEGYVKGPYNWCYPLKQDSGILYTENFANILKYKIPYYNHKEFFSQKRLGVNDFFRAAQRSVKTPIKGIKPSVSSPPWGSSPTMGVWY
jgi:hypothetical protein